MRCEEAQAIYRAGEEAVVKALCDLYTENRALWERLKALEEKLKALSRSGLPKTAATAVSRLLLMG